MKKLLAVAFIAAGITGFAGFSPTASAQELCVDVEVVVDNMSVVDLADCFGPDDVPAPPSAPELPPTPPLPPIPLP